MFERSQYAIIIVTICSKTTNRDILTSLNDVKIINLFFTLIYSTILARNSYLSIDISIDSNRINYLKNNNKTLIKISKFYLTKKKISKFYLLKKKYQNLYRFIVQRIE